MIRTNISTKKIIKQQKAFYFTTFYLIIDMEIGIVYLALFNLIVHLAMVAVRPIDLISGV